MAGVCTPWIRSTRSSIRALSVGADGGIEKYAAFPLAVSRCCAGGSKAPKVDVKNDSEGPLIGGFGVYVVPGRGSTR